MCSCLKLYLQIADRYGNVTVAEVAFLIRTNHPGSLASAVGSSAASRLQGQDSTR